MFNVSSGVQVTEGITFYLLNEGRVRMYRLQTLDRYAVQQWIEHVIAGLVACPVQEPYRVIYDLSDISLFALTAFWLYTIGSLGMTTAGIEQVQSLMAQEPQRQVKLALLTHPTLSARVLKKLRNGNTDVPSQFFFVPEQALRWLNKDA